MSRQRWTDHGLDAPICRHARRLHARAVGIDHEVLESLWCVKILMRLRPSPQHIFQLSSIRQDMESTTSLQAPTCNTSIGLAAVLGIQTQKSCICAEPSRPASKHAACTTNIAAQAFPTPVRCCLLPLPLSNSLALQDEGRTPMTASHQVAKLPGMNLPHHVGVSAVDAIPSVACPHV